MVETLKRLMIEELSYSGTLHIKHIGISPTYKCRVAELLILEGLIEVDINGFVYLTSNPEFSIKSKMFSVPTANVIQ